MGHEGIGKRKETKIAFACFNLAVPLQSRGEDRGKLMK